RAAAGREAYEEAGVSIDPADLGPLTVMHRRRPGGPIEQRVDFFWIARRWTGEPVNREPKKSAAMRWFELHALPEACVPHERRVLECLRDGTDVPAILTDGFSSRG